VAATVNIVNSQSNFHQSESLGKIYDLFLSSSGPWRDFSKNDSLEIIFPVGSSLLACSVKNRKYSSGIGPSSSGY
jgi:hypothetical protein